MMMNRTTLVQVTVCLIIAAEGFPTASPVKAFQLHAKDLGNQQKSEQQSENLWLLQVQRAELEIQHGARHPQVIALADRIQSVRDRLASHTGAALGRSTAIDARAKSPSINVPPAPQSLSTTAKDLKETPSAAPTPAQPATNAATTKAEEALQDRWIVRVYDVAPLRPSFEAAADAENLAIVRRYERGNSDGGGGTGFFQFGGTRNELADSVKPSVNSGDNQTDIEGIANRGTPSAPQLSQVTWQECLMEMVQELTSPVAKWSEDDDESYIKVIEDRLIIRQTREGHEAIADLLDQLTVSLTSPDAAGSSSNSVRVPHDPVKEFSRRTDRDSEQRLNELLWTERTPALVFPGETPLTEILRHISAVLSSRVDQPILIRTDIGALDDDSVELNEIMIKDVEIPEGLMSVGSAFEHILSQTDPQLTLVAQDGVFLLTTKTAADAEENMLLRVYDISQIKTLLLDREPSEPFNVWLLLQIVQEMSAPPARWYDTDGEGGRMSVLGERLVVAQSPEGHQKVSNCLEQLELSLNATAAGLQSQPDLCPPLNAIREFSLESERLVENRLHEIMRTERNPNLNFPGVTSLSKILAVVSEKLIGRVLIKPDIGALAEENIASLDDVLIKDLNLEAGRMSVGAALDEILSKTKPKLSWIVRNNVVLLTSNDAAQSEENHYLRIYDVSGIRALTAASGAKVFPNGASICSVISHMTAPVCDWFETDGEGGRMVIAGDQLIVRQTRPGHQLVADVLVQLASGGK
jgi:hypothetical protein